ncbi:MAG TPA: hypothetical protein VMR89_03725 [Actinomycetota bacterium]|nr:hypothetical protein [Actinomycetota bacterium]
MNVRDETGLIGKMIVVWLLILGLLAVAAIDAASIAFTTYKLADVGAAAASEGARVYKKARDVRDTCERVAQIVSREESTARLARGGCTVERPTGLVTVKLRKMANTLVAHRIPLTEKFAIVVVTETAGPPSL